MRRRLAGIGIGMACLLAIAGAGPAPDAAPALDEKPAGPGEWGYRPGEQYVPETNPPAFSWRPQKDAGSWELEVAADPAFANPVVKVTGLAYAAYSPEKALAPGKYAWRYRMLDKKGQASNWSQVRPFEVNADAVEFPMPSRADLIGRIPRRHPRLFVRPEQLPKLRELAKGELAEDYKAILKQCDQLLKSPPATAEPPKYPPGTTTKSEEWRVIWWGNREYTIKVLNGAATLGFGRLLGGKEEYGRLGKRLLMEACKWDPKGATNYHYNDEAGMPYVYFFSRAYTFLNDLLTEEEKQQCRDMMRVRGNEMYKHLNPRHLWSPYASHSNRAWHKLGEAGIAFLGEIPEAEEWAYFAMTVFWNVYPVWSDGDGGWHEGVSYWNSYISRFTHFADVMRVAMDVNAFKKPYFSRVGYYPMYLQPPGTAGGGFGDLVTDRRAEANRTLMTALAGQAQNPYWGWYVDALGGPQKEGGYIGFVRGAMPKVASKAPDDLPGSRVFRGTGQAYLNSNLKDGKENVELGFKSSPFGKQSHGYDSNNTFFLYAYGERLLAPTGRRDIYGSDHHRKWMWETKSTNGILVDGKGQAPPHSPACRGKVIGFSTSDWLDYVAGDASACYGDSIKRYERHVVFVKPELIVIQDRLEAPKPARFDLLLHAPVEIKASGQRDITVVNGGAQMRAAILSPRGLEVSVTDQYETPPRARIKVKEWHLSAASKPVETASFVTVIRVGKAGAALPAGETLADTPAGQVVEAKLSDGGTARITLPKAGGRIEVVKSAGGNEKRAALAAE